MEDTIQETVATQHDGSSALGGLNRREFLKATSLSVAGLMAGDLLASEGTGHMGTNGKPLNILFYISDQHRWDTLGAYGNPVIKTPNMDRLADQGIRFDNMFSQFPLCGPSRACFSTGQYPQTHLAQFNGLPVPMENPRLTRTLLEHGRHTGTIGIIDLEPRRGKYGCWEKYLYHGSHYPEWARRRGAKDPGEWRKIRKKTPLVGAGPAHDFGRIEMTDEQHFSRWVADTAIDLLDEWKDEPFYMWVGERLPHPPYYVPAPYDTMYDPEEVIMPPSVSSERQDYGLLRQATAAYYGMVTYVDHQFGRILDRVDELGLAENTIVIYASDHGNCLGHHDLFGKMTLYDDDARLPFIMRYPGQPKAGIVVDELCEQIDFAPTVLDMCGIPAPLAMQGRSMVPVIEGRQKGRDAVFAFESNRRQMVRTKEWKLIHTRPESESLLFDLTEDPHETFNLYGKPEYAQVEADMKNRLLSWHLETPNRTVPNTFARGEEGEAARAWVEKYMDPLAE